MIVTKKMAEEARVTLEIAPELGGFGMDFLKTIFILRAKEHHPDKGGNSDKFVACDRAYHVLRWWLTYANEEPVTAHHGLTIKCAKCGGKGHLMVQRGFRQLRMQCPGCQGRGEMVDEKQPQGDR